MERERFRERVGSVRDDYGRGVVRERVGESKGERIFFDCERRVVCKVEKGVSIRVEEVVVQIEHCGRVLNNNFRSKLDWGLVECLKSGDSRRNQVPNCAKGGCYY